MLILQNMNHLGRFIWLGILFCGHLVAKSAPIDIQTYQGQVSLSAKRVPLDELVFVVSDHCQLTTSIKEGDWPKVSVSIQKKSCADVLLYLSQQFHFQVISDKQHFNVSMGMSALGYYYPKKSSQWVLSAISASLAKKLGIVQVSSDMIAYKKEFEAMAILALKKADSPMATHRLSYFIFSVDDASYYGFKSMVENIFGQVYRQKGVDYTKMMGALVQQFSGKTSRKVSMLAHPSLLVVVPSQSKWSGEVNIPHDKNKVVTGFNIQTKIDDLSEKRFMFHVKLSFHTPIQSARSFVEKANKFESEMIVSQGELVFLHGFVFSYSQNEATPAWWTPLTHFLVGGDALDNKMWMGVWVLVE